MSDDTPAIEPAGSPAKPGLQLKQHLSMTDFPLNSPAAVHDAIQLSNTGQHHGHGEHGASDALEPEPCEGPTVDAAEEHEETHRSGVARRKAHRQASRASESRGSARAEVGAARATSALARMFHRRFTARRAASRGRCVRST